jgi:predicted dehydrogenase
VSIGLGVLGAGNYASATFLPVIRRAGGVRKVGIVSGSGVTAQNAARKFGFEFASSREEDLIDHPEVNTLVLLTRHDQHARQILAGLEAGKAVFCEKPLAITPGEVDEIEAYLQAHPQARLMVGFNRRFAALSRRLEDFISGRSEPIFAQYRVNAGFLPANHWLHDPQVGGGRIIGEGCHFIDFLSFLAGSPPLRVTAQALPDGGRYHADNVILTCAFPDGSLGTLTYLANGDKAFAKERVEVFCGGKVAVLDDFRSLQTSSNGSRRSYNSRFGQDKGHQAGWEAFLECVRSGGLPPISYTDLTGVTRATFAAIQALRSGLPVEVSSMIHSDPTG